MRTPTAAGADTTHPVRSARFRRIAIAYTTNELGNWFGYIALAVAVFEHTRSAVATAALFVAARFVPGLLVSPLVARVEVAGRRHALSALYLVEALLTAGLVAAVARFELSAILLLAAADGTVALAARALLRASVALDAADEHARRQANATLNLGWTLTNASGPVIAGVTVAALGAPLALVLDASSFLTTAALLVSVSPPPSGAPEPSWRKRLAAARGHILARGELRTLLGAEAVALVCFASVVPVEVVFAKATLAAGDSGYGALLGSWGAGMVIGSAIFARATRSALVRLLTAGTGAVGVAYVATAAAPALWVACTAAVLGGVGNGIQWAALISAAQRLAPDDLQGRLMSAVESIGAVCPAIGFSLGGAIAAATTPRVAFLVAGLGVCACIPAFARLSRRGLGASVASVAAAG